MVEARNTALGYHWDSYPDSGYSVDNLAPPPPAPFSGVYSGGIASLSWGASGAPDLAFYRLYRGPDAGFVPGPATLIATVTGTSAIDGGIALSWYKVTAVDVHGNESPAAVTLPAGTVGIDDALPATVWLGPVTPNPVAGPASFRFALPDEAQVELMLFDQQGRRVRTLADRVYAAGRHEVAWDGRGMRSERLPSGVYLYRLRAAGLERTGRFVMLR
jgi:hypothetical protein